MNASGALRDRFRAARGDSQMAVVEGIHALKHALHFGAVPTEIVALDLDALKTLTAKLAPAAWPAIEARAVELDRPTYESLSPVPHPTGVMALAPRPAVDVEAVLAHQSGRPTVMLEEPRTLGNLGASIRVAAAADAHAVITTGQHDPWSSAAICASAGLHWALPVARVDSIPGERELIAIDPGGEPLDRVQIPSDALLVFGSERDGVSEMALARAERVVGISIRPGVSSLNLATAVAVVLFELSMRQKPA